MQIFCWNGEKHQIFTATLSSEHYDYLKPKINIFEKKIRPFKTFLKSLISSFEANKYFFQWILAHSAIANDALKKYALEPHKVWKMFKTLYIVFVNDLGLYFLIILHCIKIVIILLVWPSKNCIAIKLYTKYNYNV